MRAKTLKEFSRITLGAIVLVGLSALVYGYEYGITPNHIQVLPFIAKIKNPLLFPNDYFVDTYVRFPNIYPYVMAFFSQWVGLEKLHAILYVIFKLALLVLVYYLSRALFKSNRTAWIAMFLFAFSPLVNACSPLGHDPVMKTSFYQTSAMTPVAIAAILLFLSRRYMVAMVVLAGIYYFCVLIANFLLVMFLFAIATKFITKEEPFPLKDIVLAFFAFVLLMAPGFIWLLQNFLIHTSHSSPNFYLFLKIWYPGHYYVSTFPAAQWHALVIYCFFFMFVFSRGLKHCSEGRTISSFLGAILTMWLLGFLCGEFLKARSLIILQFLRSDVLLIILGIVFAADYIKTLFEGPGLRNVILAALIIVAMADFTQPSYILQSALILLFLNDFNPTLNRFLIRHTSFADRILYVLWNACILWFIVIQVGIFFNFPNPPIAGCALSLMLLLLTFGPRLLMPRYKMAFLGGSFIIALLAHVNIIEYRIVTRNLSNYQDVRDADWKDLQLWAKNHTPVDAVFIAPLGMNGFRSFSERSVFVDWVDGAAMHWAPGVEQEWLMRVYRLGIYKPWLLTHAGAVSAFDDRYQLLYKYLYENLSEDDFRLFKKQYGTDYVIEDVFRPLSFKVVYQNNNFCIYKIDDADIDEFAGMVWPKGADIEVDAFNFSQSTPDMAKHKRYLIRLARSYRMSGLLSQ